VTINTTQFRSRLQAFDGKAISLLSETAAEFGMGPQVIDLLIALSPDPDSNVATGATWLLKAHLDQNNTFSQAQTTALIAAAPKIQPWQAQLHICQMISRLDSSAQDTAQLADWLSPLLSHSRPFLRAWSLDALLGLASRAPSLVTMAQQAHRYALEDEAASVRARARNLSAPEGA